MPHSGSSWQPQGHPATQPHEYVRGGTPKILTLFHPATGRVHLEPVSSCTNPILHGWLKERLTAIVTVLPTPAEPANAAAARAAWEIWQDGLAERFNLPEQLPPLRILLVWDNLTGHKSAEMVVWLCRHGIMPLYTPLGGSWLNMAESIQRILKRRALDGQHPRSPAEIGTWFQQTVCVWNRQPTPFLWHGKRRQRRRSQPGDGHALGGSGAHTAPPISPPAPPPGMAQPEASDPLGRVCKAAYSQSKIMPMWIMAR
jgi:transposase